MEALENMVLNCCLQYSKSLVFSFALPTMVVNCFITNNFKA